MVTLQCGDVTGLGYTYSHSTAAALARDLIEKAVQGQDAFATNAIFSAMRYEQRNYGREGVAATALSAVDIALWDLKAKLMGQPLVRVLGQMRGKLGPAGHRAAVARAGSPTGSQGFNGWSRPAVSAL